MSKLSFAFLRKEVNKHFLIRVVTRETSYLASLSTLCEHLGYPVGEALAERALASTKTNPTFHAKGRVVVFFYR